MGLDRRVVVALSVIALILAPAAALRAVCAGHSCDEPDEGGANVPFCSLPEDRRRAIVAGFREGRSPDILTVTGREPNDRVPLLFFGTGFGDVPIPDGVTLDQVAPTIAEAAGIDRPHPEVRSGKPIADGLPTARPRLILLVALEGLSSADLDASAWAEPWSAAEVTTSPDARVGSSPLDPAAVLTTIGTGGTPRQHGITGTFIRNDTGGLVRAWGPNAPVSVIATLADDLDELNDQEPRIGLVGSSSEDLGLIGGTWYVDLDRDDRRFVDGIHAQLEAAEALLQNGYGSDGTTDLLAVALDPAPKRAAKAVERLISAARRAAGGRLVAAAVGTGSGEDGPMNTAPLVERAIPGKTQLIEAAVPGGFFVDQKALARTGTTEDTIIDALAETGLFEDAFAAITVSFARYC